MVTVFHVRRAESALRDADWIGSKTSKRHGKPSKRELKEVISIIASGYAWVQERENNGKDASSVR